MDRDPALKNPSLARALLDLSSDGLELVDPATGRFLDASAASCHELGFTRDSLRSATIFDVEPALTPKQLAALGTSVSSGGTLTVEVIRRRQDGSTFPAALTIRAAPDDSGVLMIAVRNLTADRTAADERARFERAEEALRVSEDRLRTILEAEPECVKLVGEDGNLLDMNRAGLSMIEAECLGDVVGQDIIQLVLPQHRMEFRALTAQVFAGGTGALEFEIEGLKGSRRWLEMHAAPLRNREGRIIAALSVTRDVTERVSAEATRQRLEEQLRQAQKMETLGQLAGSIAHDFNNLLTVIDGYAALLESDPALPASLLDAVREIAGTSQRASSLTRQLLTVSRRQPMQLTGVDVNQLVDHISRVLGRIVGAHIDVDVTLTQSPLWVMADTSMIDQVLLNLAVNARDAMPGGGRLRIETSAADLDRDHIPTGHDATAGSFVRIRVTDTGTGISPSILPRVFEPFFTTKDVGKGTGLGLATVDSIARQHGGFVAVDTEVGVGSTFTLHLPLRSASETPAPRPAAPLPERKGGETILVVEDEVPLRTLLRQVLMRAGYSVIEAGTGREALDAWQTHGEAVDLLLTDLVMPDGLGGLDLASRLLAEKSGLKVIYTSGYSADIAGPSGHDRRLQKGVNFLSKPYRPADLLKTLRAHLDKN